ncbi:MAG: ankyrin repeat domain-containing protein [bacterium]|nr:ankyrin repeat domain-containing protein [bacterium]
MEKLMILPPEKARQKARAKVKKFQFEKRKKLLEDKRAAAKPAPEPISGSVTPHAQRVLDNRLLTYVSLPAGINAEEVSKLIGEGARVNCRDPEGRTPLDLAREKHGSVRVKADPVVMILLKHGAKTGEEMNVLDALLSEAVQNGDVTKIDQLVNEGADVNCNHDVSRQTILMIAAEAHSTIVAQMLIELGAEINLKNEFGKTALDYVGEVEPFDRNNKNHMKDEAVMLAHVLREQGAKLGSELP